MGKFESRKENSSGCPRKESLSEYEKSILEHQLEEWKLLNEYINNIDISFQQPFVIIMGIIAGIAAFLDTGSDGTKLALFILPIALASVTAHVSYQFRVVAILRGHLARLEERMNKILGKNIHMWNSALVETYMAHNNSINNRMMGPMVVFCILIVAYCFVATWSMHIQGEVALWVFIVYWLVVLVSYIGINLPPFFQNEKIRHCTYHEEDVWKAYAGYKHKAINDYKKWKNKRGVENKEKSLHK